MKPQSLSLFEKANEKSLLDLDRVKEDGQKVVGIYCTFAPSELVRAAGAVPVGLCGKKDTPIADAERVLPANLCPLIKSSYGYALTDTCPFFAASDLLIGETTCDGKKKMFELMGRIKPVYLMHLPYDYNRKEAEDYWLKEISRLKTFLEKETGSKIEDEALVREIIIHNRIRSLLKKIFYSCASDPIPLTGLEMMTVMESKNFVVDLEDYATSLRQLTGEIEILKKERSNGDYNKLPRILLTGCPVGKGSEKVLRLIEESGGIVVVQENCTGIKSFDRLVNENEQDPLKAIADRYLRTPCSCMTPNQGRFDLIGRLIDDFRIQGVVDLTWQCCHTYNIESYDLNAFIHGEYSLPFIHLETDYSPSDAEQLRTRIEAFLEVCGN
jgi:benzoyl-CoA reductase/2-hydroxyglutaryl-CoA dehydratase subunit BcrC/BadD/HgdB